MRSFSPHRFVVFSIIVPSLALASVHAPSAHAQEAAAPFDRAVVALSRDQAPFRRLLDFDGDGDLDAVGVELRSDSREYRLRAYENDGSGVFSTSFAPLGMAMGAGSTLLIEIGSLGGSAHPDVGILAGNRFQSWISDGDGTFTTTGTGIQLQPPPIAVALADVDGDGLSEIFWTTAQRFNVRLSSDGSVVSVEHGLSIPRTLRVLPRGGPGNKDLFILGAIDQVRIILGSPAGLILGATFDHGLAQAMLDVGDVDGDGDVDLAIFGKPNLLSEHHVRILRRVDAATWSLEKKYLGGPAEFLADVDGDGDPDGVCCGGGGGGGGGPTPTYGPHVGASEFQISLNDGTGVFAPTFKIPGVGSPQLAGAVDVDGDGDTDLVAGRCVFFGDGAIRPVAAPLAAPPLKSHRDISDCDGDGDPDVGFSLNGVYLNDGSGAFQRVPTIVEAAPSGTRFRGPGFPGDFDGDGDGDLLVEQYLTGAQETTPKRIKKNMLLGMYLLENDGSGRLGNGRPASHLGLGFSSGSLDASASLTVDLDDDGDLDLITTSRTIPGTSRIFLNDGGGWFEPDAEVSGWVASAADFTADGVIDLLAYQEDAPVLMPEIQPYEGYRFDSQPPFFQATAQTCSFHVDPNGSGITVGDFDLDGEPDMIFPDGATPDFADVVSIYDAFGFVGNGCVYSAGLRGERLGANARVALGDVDGDGTWDAVAGPLADETVVMSEVSIGIPVAGGYPRFARTAQLMPPGLLVDLDGDGDLDLIGAEIVFNRTVE